MRAVSADASAGRGDPVRSKPRRACWCRLPPSAIIPPKAVIRKPMRAKEPGSCRIFARPGNRRRSASRPAYGLSLPVSAWCFHPAGERSRRLARPFRMGVAARLGDGSQNVSWIALEDLVRAIGFRAGGRCGARYGEHGCPATPDQCGTDRCACAPLSCFAAGRRAGLDRAGRFTARPRRFCCRASVRCPKS